MAHKILVIIGGKNPGHPSSVRDTTQILKNMLTDCEISFLELPDMSLNELSPFHNCFVFTSLESATDTQLDAFCEYASLEKRFLCFFHEACIFNRKHSAFYTLLGVRFRNHAPYGEIKALFSDAKSHYKSEYKTYDELYRYEDFVRQQNRKVFLEDYRGRMLAFEKTLPSNTTLVYISLGHDNRSCKSPLFEVIVHYILSIKFI